MAPHAINVLHEGMNKPTALAREMEPQDGAVQKILLRKMSITRDACPITGWGSCWDSVCPCTQSTWKYWPDAGPSQSNRRPLAEISSSVDLVGIIKPDQKNT